MRFSSKARKPLAGATEEPHALGQIHRIFGVRLLEGVLPGEPSGQNRPPLPYEILQCAGTSHSRRSAPIDAGVPGKEWMPNRSGNLRPGELTGARAGVVTYGRNTFAYAEGIGSFIIPLLFGGGCKAGHDEPTMKLGCPAKCSFCIDACPTGPFMQPAQDGPRRCIASITSGLGRGTGGLTSYISPECERKWVPASMAATSVRGLSQKQGQAECRVASQ